MATSAKSFTIVDGRVFTGGGTKRKRSEEAPQSWVPTDLQIDYLREKTLIQKMEACLNKLQSSQVYNDFRHKLQTSPISQHLRTVLGSESKMQMVIYGIGSLELDENPRMQLSLAILMRKDFGWIGDIKVFDPILSAIECRILEALGCSVLSYNEYARRQALKPTMFFMPRCSADLYNNLLQVNWKPGLLNNIVIVGNSFEEYKDFSEQCMNFCLDSFNRRNLLMWDLLGHVLAAQTFTNEFRIKTNHGNLNWLHSLTWHFFSPITETCLIDRLTEIHRQIYGD